MTHLFVQFYVIWCILYRSVYSESCRLYDQTLPQAMSSHLTVYSNHSNSIYIFGGLGQYYDGVPQKYYNSIYKWNLNEPNSWFVQIGTTETTPFYSFGHNVVSVKDVIYFIGIVDCQTCGSTGEIRLFNTSSDTWIDGSSLGKPEDLTHGCLTTDGTYLYMMDGYKGNKDIRDVARLQKYDIAADNWNQYDLSQDVFIDYNHTLGGWKGQYCSLIGDELYIIGGNTGGNYVDTIDKYDIKTETYTRIGILPHGIKGYGTSVYYNDSVYLVGGIPYTSDINVFDVKSEEISPLYLTMVQKVSVTAAVIINGTIWIFGGLADNSEATANFTTYNATDKVQICNMSMLETDYTTNLPTTSKPTSKMPTTFHPTTFSPTTDMPTTMLPTTHNPTATNPTTYKPSSSPTENPTTLEPTTDIPTTFQPTTNGPSTMVPTHNPTTYPPTTSILTTAKPSLSQTTIAPTQSPTISCEFELVSVSIQFLYVPENNASNSEITRSLTDITDDIIEQTTTCNTYKYDTKIKNDLDSKTINVILHLCIDCDETLLVQFVDELEKDFVEINSPLLSVVYSSNISYELLNEKVQTTQSEVSMDVKNGEKSNQSGTNTIIMVIIISGSVILVAIFIFCIFYKCKAHRQSGDASKGTNKDREYNRSIKLIALSSVEASEPVQIVPASPKSDLQSEDNNDHSDENTYGDNGVGTPIGGYDGVSGVIATPRSVDEMIDSYAHGNVVGQDIGSEGGDNQFLGARKGVNKQSTIDLLEELYQEIGGQIGIEKTESRDAEALYLDIDYDKTEDVGADVVTPTGGEQKEKRKGFMAKIDENDVYNANVVDTKRDTLKLNNASQIAVQDSIDDIFEDPDDDKQAENVLIGKTKGGDTIDLMMEEVDAKMDVYKQESRAAEEMYHNLNGIEVETETGGDENVEAKRQSRPEGVHKYLGNQIENETIPNIAGSGTDCGDV